MEEYFEQIKAKVGPLGRSALHLVNSEMDNAWHIVVESAEAKIIK